MISAALDDDGPKLYWSGTHRVTDPETTLSRVMPLAARMGITRVAMLTGLDIIGIPVAAAIRPNSRSVAVHQGKGTSVPAAKASAVMEAAEAFHAENVRLPLRLASYSELSSETRTADPKRLPRLRGAPEPQRLFWVEGRDLMSDCPLWVPYELVSADYSRSQPADLGHFHTTTNGLASGNHWLEAALHALYEVVERDAIALWRAAPHAQRLRALDPDTVDGTLSSALLRLFRRAVVDLHIWDVTSDVGLPVFICLAISPDHTQGVEPEFGAGCHADRDIALSRALTEAAQTRVTRISGARDDFASESYDPAERRTRLEAARRLCGAPTVLDFHNTPTHSGRTLRSDLDHALYGLTAAGISQTAWVDLTWPELGIPTGRIIVPGLEGLWTSTSGGYMPGQRAHAVASR
jgi:YcaO-like protein with predicted kinase domain